MKNIHVIPTDKPSRLHLWTDENGSKLALCDLEFSHTRNTQNIYITSDEEIKEGDWMIRGNEQPIKVTKDFFWDFGVRYYKIILTTDQDLIKDGVQAIDDTFLQWFVKNPSCEEVKVDSKLIVRQVKPLLQHQGTKPIVVPHKIEYKLIIPKEELKTSEEWQKQFPNTKVIDPDGWDRKNYQYSWFEEKITLAEYITRLSRSTVYGIIPKEEQKQHLIDIMEKDEELGLYDYGWCKGNVVLPKEEIKLEDIFNDENSFM